MGTGTIPPGFIMKKLSLFLLTLACIFLSPVQAQQERPSYIAIEANSGKLLFSSNAEAKRPIASLSQVATAMVTLDWVARTHLPLDTFITVPQEAFGLRAGNPMDLQPGDRLTLRDALYSTLLGSDNVSALTIASFVGRDLVSRRGGGVPVGAFVSEMNNLARSLRMFKTRFAAPHGLDIGNSVSSSCALDMALLGAYSMQNPAFCYIVSQASRRIEVQSRTKGNTMYDISNSNKLMSSSGVDGIKAGSSRAAGSCLLLSVTRNAVSRRSPQTGTEVIYPQRMIVVVLGSGKRYELARRMMADGWRVWENWQGSGMDMTDPKEFVQLPVKSGSAKR